MADGYSLPFSNPDTADGFGSMAGRAHPHRGLDFAQPPGAPIKAVADGRVALVEHSTELGYVVVLEHRPSVLGRLKGARPVFSGYAHQEAPLPGVHVGMRVKRGQAIGHVGRYPYSGTAATGPHLHLTIGPAARSVFLGEVVDPLAFIKAHPPRRAQSAYIVTRGDTLWGIAEAHRTTVPALLAKNPGIRNPALIHPGDRIKL